MFRIVLCPLISASLTCVYAAPQQDEPGEPAGAANGSEATADTAKQNPSEEEPATPEAESDTSDTFVPSEEISEDLSVSYPVDI